MNTHTSIDYAAIKTRQRATWASGDYARIGTSLQWVGEQLAESLDLNYGSKVLDVAAGNGNVSLAVARRGNDVTSTDYVDELLKAGQARAAAEGLVMTFRVADAEALPFENATFDAVVSTFGVMFAPNQLKSAAEMLRVCRPGGIIGLANWTPSGFIGQVFATVGKHVAPPAGVQSPAKWGDRDWLNQSFAPYVSTLHIEPREFVFRYASAQHFVDFFRQYYGPVHKAFAALDHKQQAALEGELLTVIDRFNTNKQAMRLRSQYVEVVMRKR